MRSMLITAAVLAAPRAALACPVCFGESDSPMAWGANAGIFFMLGVTGVVLASFAAFFIHLMRRARLAGGQAARTGATGCPGPAGWGASPPLPGASGPQGGAASC